MKAFTEHPASVGETYFQHMGMAFSFGFRMVGAGIGCILHGIFPFLCEKSGSKMINCLHTEMVTNRDRRPCADAHLGDAE